MLKRLANRGESIEVISGALSRSADSVKQKAFWLNGELRVTGNADYYVVSLQTARRPHPWRWEIRRRSRPMGVIIGADGFQSQSAAQFAGTQALDRFLIDLKNEERRQTG